MTVVFWILAAITVAGGLAAVTLKNTVHCALALTAAFAGLALLFLQLDAQFVGFAQILVYIGAVAILVVFAILLTRSSEKPEKGVFSRTWLAGLAIAAAVFCGAGVGGSTQRGGAAGRSGIAEGRSGGDSKADWRRTDGPATCCRWRFSRCC